VDAETVDEYIAEAPEERRHTLAQLRGECLERLEGFDEGMEYRMPSYRRDGVVEVAFASQSRTISLYVLRTDVLDAHRERLTGLSVGKGAVRYRDPDEIDWDVVASMLDATSASPGPVC
jgi:uncharacterized protein YdhG (YjbR/CyaY superfamily)